jgi:hypothetical protein
LNPLPLNKSLKSVESPRVRIQDDLKRGKISL